jgi:hypothetical protein
VAAAGKFHRPAAQGGHTRFIELATKVGRQPTGSEMLAPAGYLAGLTDAAP